MSSRLLVRSATPDDIAGIGAVLEDARAWLQRRGIEQWTRPFSPEWIAAGIDAGEFRVTEVEGEIAGVFRLLWSDPLFWGELDRGESVYVHTMAVRRSFAGSGFGGLILAWIEELARGTGKHGLRLDCLEANAGLVAYYWRHGFTPVKTVEVGGDRMLLLERPVIAAKAEPE